MLLSFSAVSVLFPALCMSVCTLDASDYVCDEVSPMTAGAHQMKHPDPIEQVRGEDDLDHLPKRDRKSPFYFGIEWE